MRIARENRNRFPSGKNGDRAAMEDNDRRHGCRFIGYPSDTTKGSRAIVRALLMATVNSR